MKLDLCSHLKTRDTREGFLVETPFLYYDNDRVVVYAKKLPQQQFHVSDNGDACERLAFDGVDVDADRIKRWLDEMSLALRLSWDGEAGLLFTICEENEVAAAVFRIAEAASQLQAMTALRTSRHESAFKSEMLEILRQVSEESGVTRVEDALVHDFTADVLFKRKNSDVAVVLASSKERLLEAELMWSTIQRRGESTQVVAVIEAQEKVGRSEAERASFYTSKILHYRNHESLVGMALAQQLRNPN